MSRPCFITVMFACALTAGCDSTDSALPTLPSSTHHALPSITSGLGGFGSIQPGNVQLAGRIARLSGTCPLRSFIVRTAIVRTTTVTNIDDGCSDLENGVVIEVEGLLQGDGSVVATRIEREDDDDDEDRD